MNSNLSRREFLKLGTISVIGLAPSPRIPRIPVPPVPAGRASHRWGRVSADYLGLRSRPHPNGKFLGFLYYDDVVPIYREVVGKGWFPHNHVWFETPDGMAYSASMQPTENVQNEPTMNIPSSGLFGEISVPFADARVDPDPKAQISYRVYYSAIFLVNKAVKSPDGEWWYRVQDDAQSTLWIGASSLRMIHPDEIAPLSPNSDEKRIQVDIERQSLSAFERSVEVFRATISSGRAFVKNGQWVQAQSTPMTNSPIWSKRITRHMQGGTMRAGWDLPGVCWVSYFASNGAAIHGTYWHNNFGRPQSAGCINCTPEAARWIFRWTAPIVHYVPGHITEKWPGGTRVEITSAA